MIYIEAPAAYQPSDGDGPSIFLAGGITGCPDWQAKVRAMLATASVVVLNPRRTRCIGPDDDALAQQVAWEYHYLHQADLTLFWFPACDPRVTVQPITLLELGTAIAEAQLRKRWIVLGADAGYPRRADLEQQLRHPLPDLTVHHTLRGTVSSALHALTISTGRDQAR